METTQITRVELHELLWRIPLWRVAKQLGVLPSNLALIADEAKIPRPMRGYWNRRSGVASKSANACAPLTGDGVLLVTLLRPRAASPEGRARQVDPEERVTRPPSVRHILVQRTAHVLRGETGDWADSSMRGKAAIKIRVTRICLERALAFTDQLLTQAEARGISVAEVNQPMVCGAVFRAFGQTVSFNIREKVRRGLLNYGTIPTGRLVLSLEHEWIVGKLRKTWSDGAQSRIEHFIQDILAAVLKIAEELHLRELERQKEELERRERERIRAEAEQVRKERQRILDLERSRQLRAYQQIDRWRDSMSLLAFAEAAESTFDAKGDAELSEWLVWLREFSRRADPFQEVVKPWQEWAEHLRRSRNPDSKIQPGEHVWDGIVRDKREQLGSSV